MELFEPVQCTGNQEAAHFVARIVEHECSPFPMFAAAPVLVFVERAAIEAGQAETIPGKVARNPIQIHADSRLVAPVHKFP